MSGAICGLINCNDKDINVSEGYGMMDKLNYCKLDAVNTLSYHNVFMACGMIHVTEESKQEILPFKDDLSKLIITADAIVDNRDELIENLQLKEDEMVITDSQLILKAYVKWQEQCPKYILGDYAFVIWDGNKKSIFAARDHVGGRTLYYKLNDGIFSFSTLIKPIKENETINERWIADFLALPSVLHISECQESIYDGIYELPPAHTLTITEGTKSLNRYWNPLEEVKPIKFTSEDECNDGFMTVFSEAIRCRLRTCHEVSIMLSGGLDSSSVACIAAPMLEGEKKKLKAYTSLPEVTYKINSTNDIIEDESEYVRSIAEKYNNVELNFCRSEGKNSLTDMDKLTQILEQPYKNFRNMYWVREIISRVADNNSKVLLTGQFGNYTISYGCFPTHIKTLLKSRKLVEIIKEIKAFSRFESVSSKAITKGLIKSLIVDEYRSRKSKKNTVDEEKMFNSPINPSLIDKWNIESRFEKKGFSEKDQCYNDIQEDRKFMFDTILFSQIGTIETKLSLEKGIIFRDPTKDVRIIEFCLSLPSDEFVKNGEQRYLIRRAMKEILPNKILSDRLKQCVQAADWIERLEDKKDFITTMLKKITEDKQCGEYLDMNKLKNQIRYLGDLTLNSKLVDIRLILMSLSIYIFLKGGIDDEQCKKRVV